MYSRPGGLVATHLAASSNADRARAAYEHLASLVEVCEESTVDGAPLVPHIPAVRTSAERSSGMVLTGQTSAGQVSIVYVYALVGRSVVVVTTRSAGPPDVPAAVRLLERQIERYRDVAG